MSFPGRLVHPNWAVIELGAAILVILLDLLVPTLVVLLLLTASLLLRRNGLGSLGFNLPGPPCAPAVRCWC